MSMKQFTFEGPTVCILCSIPNVLLKKAVILSDSTLVLVTPTKLLNILEETSHRLMCQVTLYISTLQLIAHALSGDIESLCIP